jgi:hypothetical protein
MMQNSNISDNMIMLKAKSGSLECSMHNQVLCIRNRATLLEVKKLTDVLRKQCLEHAKELKNSKKKPSNKIVPTEDIEMDELETITESSLDLQSRSVENKPELVPMTVEPVHSPEPEIPIVLFSERERATKIVKKRVSRKVVKL